MLWVNLILRSFYRTRMQYRRFVRLLYPSPAELRFIKIMGGRVVSFERITSRRTGFPLAIVLSKGKVLRHHKMRREVRVGRCFVDFGNDVKWAIEIDGHHYHMDIVKEQKRDDYLHMYGWRVLHIRAADLYNKPKYVSRVVHNFLR